MNDTIKEFVEEVLKEYPKSRDDDFLLCLHTYIKMGFAKRSPLGIMIYFKNIDSAPVFETITRIRREIQNDENRLKPSEETQLKRINNEIKIHDYFASKSSKNLDTMKNSWMSP